MKHESNLHGKVPKVLDGAIVAFLFVFAAAAPNSIAATQSAWLIGMLLWVVRFAFRPTPKLRRTPIDYLILGFFILSGVSSFLSYEPTVSIGKLRAAALFTILYLFAENVPSLRVARLLALTLLAACLALLISGGGMASVDRKLSSGRRR